MNRNFTNSERKQIMAAKREYGTYEQARTALARIGLQISVSGMKKIAARYKEHRHYNSQKRRRPRKTTQAQDRALRRMALRERRKPFAHLARDYSARAGLDVSSVMVSRRLKEQGLCKRRAVHRPQATPAHIASRLTFAMAHEHRTIQFGRRIKFSDEKMFSSDSDGHVVLVTRREGEKYHPHCIVPQKKWGPRIHAWGMNSWAGVGPLRRIEGSLTAARYVNEVIPDIRTLCTQRRGRRLERFIFQQDNARPHAAATRQQFLAQNRVQTLHWPPNSPDFNPIEHVWAHVQSRVRARGTPGNMQTLWEWVLSECDTTPVEYIRSLYRSMPARVLEALQNRGGYGHY